MSERQAKAHLIAVSRMVEGTTPAIAERVLAELEAAVREETIAAVETLYRRDSAGWCSPDHPCGHTTQKECAIAAIRALGKEKPRDFSGLRTDATEAHDFMTGEKTRRKP